METFSLPTRFDKKQGDKVRIMEKENVLSQEELKWRD